MTKRLSVVLQKDVPNLGKQGEVCSVAIGFAKNALLPQGLAVLATAEAISIAKRVSVTRQKEAGQEAEGRARILTTLRSLHLTLSARTNEKGVLFGGIGEQEIIDGLASHGIPRDSGVKILQKKKISAVGEYPVPVRFGGETITLALTVVSAEQKKQPNH